MVPYSYFGIPASREVKELPSEILEIIFCEIIDPNSLLQCRRVCRQWKDIIDRLILKKRIVIPYILHYKSIEHVDQQIITKLKKSIGQNLLKNPFSNIETSMIRFAKPSSAYQALRNNCKDQFCHDLMHWHAIGYFRLEKPPVGTTSEIPKHVLRSWGFTSTSDLTVFASLGRPMNQRQRIHLAQNGVTDEIMDQIQPMIVLEMWFGNRFDFDCIMEIFLTLMNSSCSQIAQKCFHMHIPCSGSGDWRKVVVKMENYGPGVRIIELARLGRENYIPFNNGSEEFSGPKFTFSRISIELPKY